MSPSGEHAQLCFAGPATQFGCNVECSIACSWQLKLFKKVYTQHNIVQVVTQGKSAAHPVPILTGALLPSAPCIDSHTHTTHRQGMALDRGEMAPSGRSVISAIPEVGDAWGAAHIQLVH